MTEHAGYFVRPTILDNVSSADLIAQTEVFGPVAVIIPATDGPRRSRSQTTRLSDCRPACSLPT